MCYSIAMKAKSFEEIPADLSAVESEPKKTEASEMPVKQSVEQSEKVDRRPEAIAAREAAHMEALEKKFGGLPLEDLIQAAIYAAAEDPEMAKEIVKRVNRSFHDRFHSEEKGDSATKDEGLAA